MNAVTDIIIGRENKKPICLIDLDFAACVWACGGRGGGREEERSPGKWSAGVN